MADIAAFLPAPTTGQIDQWQRDLDVEVAARSQLLDHVARTLDSTEVTPMPTDPSRARLQHAVPVLASLDIETTQRFYGVDQLYEEMEASGVIRPNGSLTDQPRGLREFAVLDGDGNLIKFGQRTAT